MNDGLIDGLPYPDNLAALRTFPGRRCFAGMKLDVLSTMAGILGNLRLDGHLAAKILCDTVSGFSLFVFLHVVTSWSAATLILSLPSISGAS